MGKCCSFTIWKRIIRDEGKQIRFDDEFRSDVVLNVRIVINVGAVSHAL